MFEGLSLLDYPFLIKDPVEFLRIRGDIPPGLGFIEAMEATGAYQRTLDIIRMSVAEGKYARGTDRIRELMAFHAALLVLEAIGDKWALRRLSVSVAKSVSSELYRMSDEKLSMMARMLGFDLKVHSVRNALKIRYRISAKGLVFKTYPLSTKLTDYLKWSSRLKGDPKWKLTNAPVVSGRVYLDRRRAIRLIQEVIANRIENMALYYKPVVSGGNPPKGLLGKLIEEAREIIVKKSPRVKGTELASLEGRPIIKDAFPPCIKRLLLKASSGSNLSHHERFVIATFLINIGASEDEVVDVFRAAPDFKEKIARYQVQHLMGKRGGGKKYLPYNCETMKTLGLCVAECGVKTPLQYYRKALKRKFEAQKNDKDNNV